MEFNNISSGFFELQQLKLPSTVQTLLVHSLGLQALPLHVHQILLTALCYFVIFTVISPACSHALLAGSYRGFSPRSKALWHLGIVKMIKSPLNCILSIAIIMQDAQRASGGDAAERVWGYSERAGFVQSLAMGFFVFELIVAMQHFDALGLEILLHALVSSASGLLGFRPVFNYYVPRFILLELANFFAVLDGSFLKFRMNNTPVYRYNQMVRLALNGFCTMIWAPYQLYLAISDCLIAIKVGGPEGQVLPLWVAVWMLGGISLLTCMGMHWFKEAAVKTFREMKVQTKKEQ